MTTSAPAAGPLVTLDAIRDAATLLRDIAVRSPMVEVAGRSAFLKCEHLQPIGAFKIRGAYTALSRLDPARRAQGVVTSSSGNHGQAVAWAARRFGVRSVIVMPESAPAVKVAGVRAHDGEVVFAGKTRSPEQQARADRYAREDGLVMIPPFEHPDVIAGQGTCGVEIVEQVPAVASVLVPVGGGGLLAGVTVALKALRPEADIIGVEPEGAAKLTAALAAGRPVPTDEARSLADGLLPRSLGTLPWSLVQGRVHRAVTVSDAEIAAAVRWLFEKQGLRVEPSGAVSVAALLSGRVGGSGPVVAVLSGGNVDQSVFERLVTG